MKITLSFLYQLRDQRMAILVYYIVLVSMILVSLIAMPFVSSAGDGSFLSTNGVTSITIIFALILSLCAFKESFFLNLQHGVSRRSQFIGRLAAMGTACAIMAAADEAYTLMVSGLQAVFPDSFHGSSLYSMAYEGESGALTWLLSVVFSFFALMAVCSLGYLISVFMYRLNKIGKIIFWSAAPILFVAFLSHVTTHIYGKVAVFLANLAGMCFSTLPRMILTCTLLTAVFSALAWLLMRRAAIK